MVEDSELIDEASKLAELKLVIFEAATERLKDREIQPNSDILRDIVQRVNVSILRKLRNCSGDKAAFEGQMKQIVENVVDEYRKNNKSQI